MRNWRVISPPVVWKMSPQHKNTPRWREDCLRPRKQFSHHPGIFLRRGDSFYTTSGKITLQFPVLKLFYTGVKWIKKGGDFDNLKLLFLVYFSLSVYHSKVYCKVRCYAHCTTCSSPAWTNYFTLATRRRSRVQTTELKKPIQLICYLRSPTVISLIKNRQWK